MDRPLFVAVVAALAEVRAPWHHYRIERAGARSVACPRRHRSEIMNTIRTAPAMFRSGAQAFWLTRGAQEKKFLTAGGGVAALALLYALLYALLIAPAVAGCVRLEWDFPLLR